MHWLNTIWQHQMTASLDEPIRCSPPQYETRARAREARMLLEERLIHFIGWLKEQGYQLIDEDTEIATERTELELVMHYVNT